MEELSWRGLVYSILEERMGTRRAWPATAVLYAAAHLPTLILLRAPFAGPNPLLVIAALGCGLIWGLLVARTGRLPVAIASHALFTWGIVLQFPLRPFQ
jgi:CAAX protease family protein